MNAQTDKPTKAPGNCVVDLEIKSANLGKVPNHFNIVGDLETLTD